MNQRFDDEQKEIVDYINTLKRDLKKPTGRKGRWNKYIGDVTNNIVVSYLSGHLPDGCLAAGPGVYVEGVANEFDVLITDKKAEHIKFSRAYPRDFVYMAVEVKERGFFYKKTEAERLIREARDDLLENLGRIPLLYITLHESPTLMGATRRVYGNDAFFLSTGTYKHLRIIEGEWQRFVNSVCTLIA